jgi:hypothetical protein
MVLLFAATVTTLVLFSQRAFLSEYIQSYRASLVLNPPNSPQDTITLTPLVAQPVVVERPMEPVVFGLIMYSETSAKEGAILLKVKSLTWVELRLNNKDIFLVRNNVH